MSGFFALFLLGTFWFYFVTTIFIIFVIIFEEKESAGWALTVLVIYGLYFQFIAKGSIFEWAFENPFYLLGIASGYIIIGLIWSWVKWWLFVNRIAEKKKDAWQDFLKQKNLPADTKSLSIRQNGEWESHCSYDLKKPLFSKNKSKITIWVTYWPLSMIWSLINDFIKKIIHQIVIRFQKFYEHITNKAFKDIDYIKIIDKIKEEKRGLNQRS